MANCLQHADQDACAQALRIRIATSFEFAPGTDKILCERPYSSSDAKLRALGLA